MMKIEREAILSDAVLSMVLELEAESVGVSLEAYVDRFLEVFYSDSEKLLPLLNVNK
jgi:hypothetical protein